MSEIRLLRWPGDIAREQQREYARIWKAECGGNLWDSQYPRAFAIMDDGVPVAVLLYLRITSHRINFGRMTLTTHRGRGYAGILLQHLIDRFPRDTLECQNINKNLTDGLVRAGFKPLNDKLWTFRRTPRRR